MHALKLFCTFEDMNNHIRTKVDPKYKDCTFIPIKAEINENDLSLDITFISTDDIEDKNYHRYKVDLQSDKKIPERGQRVKINPVDDYSDITLTNKICESEEDYQWECCGMSTAGSTYRCKICGTHKTVPIKRQENTTISTHFNEGSIPCFDCVCVANYSLQCVDCNAENGFKYFEKEN